MEKKDKGGNYVQSHALKEDDSSNEYALKSSIFFKGDVLLITVSSS